MLGVYVKLVAPPDVPLTKPLLGMVTPPVKVPPTLVFTLIELTIIHCVGSSMLMRTMFKSI